MYNYLIDFDRYRYPNLSRPTTTVGVKQLSERKAAESAWDAVGNAVIVPGTTLTVKLNGVRFERVVEYSADSNDTYEIAFLRGGKCVAMKTRGHLGNGGLTVTCLELRKSEVKQGYDTIVFIPTEGDNAYGVGHVLLK
ncbi:hypothetical protein FACS1894216_16840 [Synergistales bacterium]|nr:hypothetical protein FACS1894216_16840 [Synergistales bacterium]